MIIKPMHFCPDWDYNVVAPGSPEMDCCTCLFGVNPVSIESSETGVDSGGSKETSGFVCCDFDPESINTWARKTDS